MNDSRLGGLAWIAAAVGFLATMSVHPTGHDLFQPGHLEAGARIARIAHALALVSLPLAFLGALALARRLDSPQRTAIAALVVYGFALTAVMLAAIASGFVGPAVIEDSLDGPQVASEVWKALMHYNWALNQACAQVYVVGSSVAILLWSLAIARTRALATGLGIFGLVLAPLTILALLSGHIRLDVHGFGLIVVGQALWSISAGVSLWRRGGGATSGA